MILVTVGHQTPFDRLIEWMDRWAASHPETRVFCQIGEGAYVPGNMEWCRWLAPEELDRLLRQASLLVSHAGTGTIMQALEKGKPLLVVPRLAKYQETRNDHQVGTARYFAQANRVFLADSEEALKRTLDHWLIREPQTNPVIGPWASEELIERIRSFLAS